MLLKRILQRCLAAVGYELHRQNRHPASRSRPIGQMRTFLEDVKARGFAPSLVLDVGANRGLWARMAQKVFPDARFLMIEPQHEMEPFLETLCTTHPGFRWIRAGAGHKSGKLVLTVWEDLQGSSFLPKAREDFLKVGKQRLVPIVTLNEVLAAEGLMRPELVKIDVQGFELEVLKGADSLLGETELFVLEVSLYSFQEGMPRLRDIVSYMGDHGYEVYDIAGFLRRPLDGALGQVDLAFARSRGVLRASGSWNKIRGTAQHPSC